MQTREIEIERRDRVTHGEYLARTPDRDETAKLTWMQFDSVRTAEHTFVPAEMRGQGIAERLVEALVSDARREGFLIQPDCSYVAKKFDENPDWSDLRA